MMNELLKRLSEVAPEFCKPDANFEAHYWIDGQIFWQKETGELATTHQGGQPEMWLQAALQEEIERREWEYEHRFFAPLGNIGPRHKVIIMRGRGGGEMRDTAAEALGWALVKAVGDSIERED